MNKSYYNVVNHTKGIEIFTEDKGKANELFECMKRANTDDQLRFYTFYKPCKVSVIYDKVFFA